MSATALLPVRLWRSRSLVGQLVRREILARYRGSMGGVAWSLVTPVLMLGIYTYVFSVVFRVRWGDMAVSRVDFAVLLFSGLLVYNVFAECALTAPRLVTDNPNYVKKVVFPLEFLSIVAAASAVFHFLVGFAVLIGFCLVVYGTLHWTVALVPLAILPAVFLALGASWLFSSLGVFLQDLRHFVALLTTALLFLSPIFYPLGAVPEEFRPFVRANPLSLSIEHMRDAAIFGRVPNATEWAANLAFGLLFAAAAYWWFQRTRHEFADLV
jgi:lipopolysaccharide transport system permease protein